MTASGIRRRSSCSIHALTTATAAGSCTLTASSSDLSGLRWFASALGFRALRRDQQRSDSGCGQSASTADRAYQTVGGGVRIDLTRDDLAGELIEQAATSQVAHLLTQLSDGDRLD